MKHVILEALANVSLHGSSQSNARYQHEIAKRNWFAATVANPIVVTLDSDWILANIDVIVTGPCPNSI